MFSDRRDAVRPGAGRPGLLGLIQRRAYLPILVLVPALAIGLGLLAPRPASHAAEIVDRAEVGGFVFEKSDDDMLGITDTARGLRLELDLHTVPDDPTEEQLNSLRAEVAASVKDLYSWDLNSSTDRNRIREEVLALAQALHTIPDESFNVEENQPLLALRDVADGIEGVSECRGRCLPEGNLMNRVIATGVAAIVNRMLADFTNDLPGSQVVVLAVSVLVGGITEFTFNVGPALTGIPAADLRRSAIAGAISMLILVKSYLDDARALAANSSGTVKDEAKKGAEEVAAITPTEPENEPTSDYDMVKDEL
jgi:hypothetical protein